MDHSSRKAHLTIAPFDPAGTFNDRNQSASNRLAVDAIKSRKIDQNVDAAHCDRYMRHTAIFVYKYLHSMTAE